MCAIEYIKKKDMTEFLPLVPIMEKNKQKKGFTLVMSPLILL